MAVQDLLSLKGKTAIVTGGAIGIGFGIASRLAEAGANVVIASKSADEDNKATESLKAKGYSAIAIPTDVSNEEGVKGLIEGTVKAYGGLDILVNNAGIYPDIPLKSMTLHDFQKVIDVNLNGVFLCTKYASEQMIKQNRPGKIINVTSIDALHPSMIGLAHYDASKHGVWGFTKNIALELAPHKIYVNAVAPGGISTPGVQKLQQSTMPSGTDINAMMEAFKKRIPMGRFGEPDDIGKVALFLASDMSSYMTGSQIVVDGGMLLT